MTSQEIKSFILFQQNIKLKQERDTYKKQLDDIKEYVLNNLVYIDNVYDQEQILQIIERESDK